MKRIFALLLSVILALSLTACSAFSSLFEELPELLEEFSTESTDSTDSTQNTETSLPPVTDPPVTEPPIAEPPITEPPVTEPPLSEPPETQTPVVTPPAEDPPAEEPPVITPPVENPPVEEPPVEEPPVADPPQEDNGLVTAEQLRRIEEGFLMLVNLERQNCGVGTLAIDSVLDEAAQVRSAEIVELFSHTRPDGTNCFTAVDTSRYPAATMGENICFTSHVGTGYYTPADVWVGSDAQIEAAYGWIFTLFKNSPGHYDNMIKAAYNDCGIGLTCVVDEHGIPYFYLAHMFGSKYG